MGNDSLYFFTSKNPILGEIWGVAVAGGDPGRAVVGVERGKEREGGGEGAGGPGHCPCHASLHGVTGLSRQCMWRDR